MKRGTNVLLTALCSVLLVGAFVAPAGARSDSTRSIASGPKDANARLQMYETVVDAATAASIMGGGYDVATADALAGAQVRLVLVLYPWERTALLKQGVQLVLWRNDDGLTATQLAQQQSGAGFKVWRPFDGPNGLRAYMYAIAEANPDLLKLEVLGHTWGTDPEGDGPDAPREILALKL